MMATEAPQDNRPNEAAVTSDEPTIKIDTDAQNVQSGHLQVNGDTASTATDEIDNKQISDIVDDLVNSAEVSISGGSDNEASRSKLNADERGHGRTSSSVKKPTSFKAVSVNKTFLAAKGASANLPSKANDKSAAASGLSSSPGSTSLTAARPRLIAKSGSGLVTKSSTGLNGAKGTAPDPNAVWNKNRPVPPPEPKKLTDEELQKKYGIHMATRLHTDDTKGQANWADIDDDDDDWAPESITWKDGTKITIPHVEEHPPAAAAPVTPAPAPVSAPPPVQQIPAKELEKPKSPVPSILSSKPSLPSGKGLVFSKNPLEKPTLVAKPPAPPTPVKSPWAQIPKVDKASPVVIEPPTSQQGSSRFGPRDVPGPKSITPPPPKEIAADDFSRTPWRDGPGASNRELFNSQSGRYEPVTDRRGAVRNDQHSRPAAVLQRSQHDTQGPAEPSAAFQTSRVSEQHNPYGRRRGSSIVSGGSGSYTHLKGQEQPSAPPELLTARRDSFTPFSDNPMSPVRTFSPSAQHAGGQRPVANPNWQPHISPASTHSLPHHPPTDAALPAGPQGTAAVAAPVVTEDDIALQKRLMHEKRELAMKRRKEEELREELARKERIRLKLEALGPAPEPRSAKKAAAKDEAPTGSQAQQGETSAPQVQKAAVGDNKQSDKAEVSPAKPEPKPEALANAVPDQALPKTSNKDNIEERPQQQGPVHVAGWPTGPAHHPEPFSHKNVWASPSYNSRSLGNGTFNPELANKHVPSPIAPPSTSRAATNAPSAPATRPAPIGPPRQVPRQPSSNQHRGQVQNAWAAAVQSDDIALARELRAREEEKARELKAEGLDFAAVQAPIKDTWRPTKISDDGRRINEKAQQTYHASKAPGWGKSGDSSVQPPQGPLLGSAQGSSVSVQVPPAASTSVDASSGSILGAATSTTPQQTRTSRFFPSRDVRQETTASTDSQGRSSSPSPPPPDMAGHPAFDGDVSHPHVSLPRPQPVVRLPPAQASPAPMAPPRQTPNFGWAAPVPYTEHEATSAPTGPSGHRSSAQNAESDWQARINSLLVGRNASSHAKSVPVDSSSRHSLENARHGHPTTISLPRGLFKNLPSDNEDSPTTKEPAETCFGEQEMGSLPKVTMPNNAPEAAWHPSAAPKPMPKKFWPSVSSAEQLTFHPDVSGSGTVIRVFAPGMSEPKPITVPFARNRSNPRRGGRGAGRHAGPPPPHRGGKSREPSASYSNEQSSSSAGPSTNRGGRGGYPRRDNWSRHNGPAPIPI